MFFTRGCYLPPNAPLPFAEHHPIEVESAVDESVDMPVLRLFPNEREATCCEICNSFADIRGEIAEELLSLDENSIEEIVEMTADSTGAYKIKSASEIPDAFKMVSLFSRKRGGPVLPR